MSGHTHLQLNTGNETDAKTTAKADVSYTGTGTAPTATYESSDAAVATVDPKTGAITAKAKGTAKITATAINPDNGKSVTASVTIQVTDQNSK